MAYVTFARAFSINTRTHLNLIHLEKKSLNIYEYFNTLPFEYPKNKSYFQEQ